MPPDDAAVMLPPPGMAVVQSVDHFRAFIDDPFVFGEIAAAHALSDLHAMGARPWTALAVAAVPYTSGDKMRTELADMLQGASRRACGRRLRAGGRPQRRGRRAGAGVRGHRPGRSREAAAQVGTAGGRRTGADQAARHRHRAGRAHARTGARGMAAGGDRVHAREQRHCVADSARVRRGRVHRRHRLRAGRTSAGDAARLRRRRGAVARSDAGAAGRIGTRHARRREHAGAGEPPAAARHRHRCPHSAADRPADLGRIAGRNCVGARRGLCRGVASRGIEATIVGVVERGKAALRMEL